MQQKISVLQYVLQRDLFVKFYMLLAHKLTTTGIDLVHKCSTD